MVDHPRNAFDRMHEFGNAEDALLYAAAFVPTFVEIEGRVFLRGSAELDHILIGEIIRLGHDPEEVGRSVNSFNWVEVPYLFADRRGSDANDRALAEALVVAWRGRLQADFPNRRFTVRVLEPEETGSVVGVGFEEVR